MNDPKKGFGLTPLPEDTRDFSLGAVFSLPKLSELPAEFILEDPFPVRDQGETDLCTAYATCGMSQLQEGVELCPEYSFALGKSLSGNPDAWGQDLRTAMKAHVKFGALEIAPLKDKCLVEILDPRRLDNWPDGYRDLALPHMKASFLTVDGPYDAFDNIRASLWRFREEKRAVGLGVEWSWPLELERMDEPGRGTGHMVFCRGWKTVDGMPYLVIRNSLGEAAGKKGEHLFSRKVVNAFVPTYGAFTFADITREEYLRRIRPGFLTRLNAIIAQAFALARTILLIADHERAVEEANAPALLPEPIAPVDTPTETMPDMVRRVCVEEGLTEVQAAEVYATIECESGFDPKARNRNVNGTTDYGICQFNSKWYIGPGLPIPSVDVALNDPERCVRVMCRAWKQGRKRDWICYRKLYGSP